ncbi:YciI family protein, partial [Granulosicoccus sp.]|nr:YciI family protein [Granulosicoccus sp.]
WMSWIEEGSKQGWIADGGDALTPEGHVVRAGDVVTDGPFAESKELVNGFTIVLADSLKAATALAAKCPIFDAGGCVEVRPLAEVGS